MRPIRMLLPPEAYSLVVITLLFSYQDWVMRLADAREKKDVAEEKNALSALMYIGKSVQVLVGNMYTDKSFIDGLAEYCKVYQFNINPAKLISDIISGRYIADHPEAN